MLRWAIPRSFSVILESATESGNPCSCMKHHRSTSILHGNDLHNATITWMLSCTTSRSSQLKLTSPYLVRSRCLGKARWLDGETCRWTHIGTMVALLATADLCDASRLRRCCRGRRVEGFEAGSTGGRFS